MRKKNGIQWFFAIMFLCCALGTGFRVGSLFYLMAAVLMAPIKELREKIKLPKALIITLSVVLCFLGAMISPVDTSNEDGPKDKQEISQDIKDEDEDEENEKVDGTKDEEQSTVKDTSSIEAYSGVAYTVINDNIPSFSSEELTTTGYEKYSDLDSLGRCGVAIASCGKEIMPKEGEERGSISSVTPSGWVQAKYEGVSGGYLYNRCHLIGWQLSAENANKKNLLTGTRYMNTEGMLVFENMVADYIKETGNHVAYRITPIYEGNNLVASGVQMEAYSIEDDGEGICFNVYCYNVQPGIQIDYATGKSRMVLWQ